MFVQLTTLCFPKWFVMAWILRTVGVRSILSVRQWPGATILCMSVVQPQRTRICIQMKACILFNVKSLFQLLLFSDTERLKQSMSHLMTKPTKWHVRPAKTQISLGIRPVWSESSLSAWRKLGSLATHWARSEYADQTGWMPRLI